MSARLIKTILERAKKANVSPRVTIVCGVFGHTGVITNLDTQDGFVELLLNQEGKKTFVVLDQITFVTSEVAL